MFAKNMNILSKSFDIINCNITLYRNCLLKIAVSLCLFSTSSVVYVFILNGNLRYLSFRIYSGIRQRGTLSPVLFNVYLDYSSVRWNLYRQEAMSTEFIKNHIMYADDYCTLALP